ncbi:unnamed protein product [Chilo suppressalis]|uniref:Uncharacterized protein n=1 Tax=Chilo suppressalis TaxID=168631 RepID=A0ABN8B640_CHISP|nr:unnamed protein product [Chilo suppressalis]
MEPASTPIKSLDENSITSLHAAVQNLVKSNAEILRRLTEIEKHTFEVSQLHKRIEDLKRDCEHDRRRIAELEDRIDLYEGHSRDSSIEIQGVPITENEDLYEHVQKLGQKVDVTISRNDISHCYRIKTINTTNANTKTLNRIIVRFVHKYKRDLFLKQSRKKKDDDKKSLLSTAVLNLLALTEISYCFESNDRSAYACTVVPRPRSLPATPTFPLTRPPAPAPVRCTSHSDYQSRTHALRAVRPVRDDVLSLPVPSDPEISMLNP